MPEIPGNPLLTRLRRECEHRGFHWPPVFWSFIFLMGFCVWVVLIALRVLLPFDVAFMRAIAVFHGPDLDLLFGLANYVAAAEVTLIAMLLLSLALWRKGVPFWRAVSPMIFLFSVPIEFALKFGLDQPSPSTMFYRETLRYNLTSVNGVLHSFPSGHGIRTMFMVVVVGYLFEQYLGGFRLVAARSGLAALVILSAVSKTYQGHHWPSDMFGGFLLGACLGLATISILAHGLEIANVEKRNKPGSRVGEPGYAG